MLDCTEINLLDFLLFFAALAVSALFTRVLIAFSKARGIFDYPGGRKTHRVPTPFLGGVAIFATFWLGILVYVLICQPGLGIDPKFLPAFFFSSLLIFIAGLIDDFVDLKFYIKLIVQILAAVILISYGFHIVRLYVPFYRSFALGWAAYPVTVIWVVILTNSINLIDGMDGLAGVVGISVCIGLLIISGFLNIELIMLIAVLLAGCLAGFLVFNRPPARIYMGDSGALFIGFVFAVAAVVCPIKSFTAVSMFVPLVAVSLPLLETVSTIVRRILTGQKIYQPDNRHIYHYLLRFNFSERAILLILGLISLLFNAFIPALFWFDRKQVFSIFVLFLITLVAIFFILKLAKGSK